MRILKTEFTQGLIWNYISIFFLAIGGITFSFLIGLYYDAETLGNFNLIYAYYIVLSQIGVWGCHMAVTKYVSEYADDIEKVNTILSCAVLLVGFSAMILGLLIWLICVFFIRDFLSGALLNALYSLILAVFFFSINKVILGYLNGLSKMKEYAIFQSLRNILIAAWIIFFAVMDIPGNKVSFCFVYTEIIIFLLEIPIIIIKERFRVHLSIDGLRKIVFFGTRIMPANIVLELSTKVDILCLSWVLKDERTVGIYSFAILFAEGFYQLFVVVRRSINPYVTQNYKKKELGCYYKKIENKIKRFGYSMAVTGLIIIAAGYRILCLFLDDQGYQTGIFSLVIVMVAIAVNMKSIIFGNILSQTGYPLEESVNNIITVMANFILNIVFIYKWGMIGAAFATGTSYFIFSFNQRVLVKKKLKLY